VLSVPELVYLGSQSSYSPPFIPVPLKGRTSHSLLPLCISRSTPPLASEPHSLSLFSIELSSDMASMDMILGPIVLAVVANVSSMPSALLRVSSDADRSGRLYCMGRVWYSGTRTGPLGSGIYGTQSESLSTPNMGAIAPFWNQSHHSPFFSEFRLLIYCTRFLASAHVSIIRVPDLFSLS